MNSGGKTSQHGVVRVYVVSRQVVSYDIVGRDAATGVRFRQQASFSAGRSRGVLIGSAMVTRTLIGTGVICQSPQVFFRVSI